MKVKNIDKAYDVALDYALRFFAERRKTYGTALRPSRWERSTECFVRFLEVGKTFPGVRQ